MLLTALLKPAVVVNGKKYKIMSQIGEGAFGYVYHVRSAHANDKGDSYALKKMICQTDEQMIEAKREMDVMLKIDHCNVMPLLNFSYLRNKKGQDEVYMVMPLYHTSVQAIIDHGPGFPYCAFNDGLDVVKILRHSMEGLRALHEAGFRHGDFKPANILVTETFDAVITDFGSTSPLETKVTSRATALQVQDFAASHSTASYRAPELFDTPNECIIDGKADMWALGCTMFCLLFSRTPFETAVEGLSTLSVMASQYTVPEDNIWPEDYVDLIRRCLTVDATQRIDAQEMQLSLKRLSGPPLDLQRHVKAKVASPADNPAAVSPMSTAGSLSQAQAAGEVSPDTSPSSAPSAIVHAEKDNAVPPPPPPPEQPSSPGSFRFSADFANFEGAPIGEEKSSLAEAGKLSGNDTNLESHIARDSSIGDFASSSLSFSAGRRDSWGGFVSVGSRQEASSLVAALAAEVASSNPLADECSAEDAAAAAKADASSVAATESPFVVDMQGSGSEGPKEGSESMTSMVEVAISEHTDDAVEIHSSDQPEENASDDADDDDEEEFGDFSSNYVAPMVETATGPRLTHPSDVPHVTTDASLAGGQVVSAEDRSKASSPTVDLHQHLLHEATIAEHVLKQGKVYMMRLGGFPKKMMRKEVWLVVTSTGLIVQKESGVTSEQSKIHELLSFHQPLSLTPSDTLTVGLNGLLMNGFSPLALSSSTSLSAFSHPSTPSSMSTVSEDNDWVQIDLSPKGSASSSSYGIVVPPATTAAAAAAAATTSTQRVRSRFVACRIELAFQNKDELNEWMDVIWQQYEVTRGFT